jgi:hypothetical protein
MNSRNCMNCLQPKPVNSDFHCPSCSSTASEAREYAVRENQDIGATVRAALAARAPSAMGGKRPDSPFERIDTSGFQTRLAVEPGADNDPRRAR